MAEQLVNGESAAIVGQRLLDGGAAVEGGIAVKTLRSRAALTVSAASWSWRSSKGSERHIAPGMPRPRLGRPDDRLYGDSKARRGCQYPLRERVSAREGFIVCSCQPRGPVLGRLIIAPPRIGRASGGQIAGRDIFSAGQSKSMS